MKRLFLAFVLVALLTGVIAANADMYRVYVPYYAQDVCRYFGEFGGAWLHGNPETINEDMHILCMDEHYNYGSIYPQNGGIPMMYCDQDATFNFYEMAQTYWQNHTGAQLDLNEPDRSDQCNLSPTEAAIAFRNFETISPNACHVAPNIFNAPESLTWLRQFIQEYRRLYGVNPNPCHWSTHWYIWDWQQLNYLDDFCAVLESEGIACTDIWITEFGTRYDYADAYGFMYNLTKVMIEDSRISKAFLFTNREFEGLYVLNENDRLMINGQGYVAALRK